MAVTQDAGGAPLRVLFVSDTHLGFDLPARPRVDRRRRGPDFFACFERALEPALRGEADVVVHGGDLLYRSRVPSLARRARAAAAAAGGRRRGRRAAPPGQPRALGAPVAAARRAPAAARVPRTRDASAIERHGLRVAFAGFPYARGVRQAFPALLAATGYRRLEADARVLCLHQCVEGAVCGPPPGFTFRDGEDVVRTDDLPDDVAVVLSGHIHRHQVLRATCAGGRSPPRSSTRARSSARPSRSATRPRAS